MKRVTAFENLYDDVDINRSWKQLDNFIIPAEESLRYELSALSHGSMTDVQNCQI
jgi:hypothetical protein